MSDSEHLAKLLEGRAAWNEWRASNPDIVPDLSDTIWTADEAIDLAAEQSRLDLSGVLLTRADLSGRNLSRADLISADLEEADLSGAILTGADLRFANLINARLDDADLSGAQLTGAFLAGARLDLARNLTQAQIDAVFGDHTTLLPPGLIMPEGWRDPFALTTEIGEESGEAHDWLAADPYSVLEIERPATMVEVRAAYIRLAKRYHPDHNLGDRVSEERFKRVNHAYRLLVARDRLRREKRRDQAQTPISWATAVCMCLLAFAVPGALVYWLDLPALIESSQWLGGATKAGPEHADASAGRSTQSERNLAAEPTEPAANPMAKLAAASGLRPQQAADKPAGAAAPISEPSVVIPVKAEQPAVALEQDMTQDEAAWAKARRQSTITALEAYLNAHPEGRYAAEARDMLTAVRAKSAATRKEQVAWLRAKAANTPQAYRDFLSVFPNGRHAAQAQRAARSKPDSLNTSATLPKSQSVRPWPPAD